MLISLFNNIYWLFETNETEEGDCLTAFGHFKHGYQTVKCINAVKKRNPIHVLPVLRVRCSKR